MTLCDQVRALAFKLQRLVQMSALLKPLQEPVPVILRGGLLFRILGFRADPLPINGTCHHHPPSGASGKKLGPRPRPIATASAQSRCRARPPTQHTPVGPVQIVSLRLPRTFGRWSKAWVTIQAPSWTRSRTCWSSLGASLRRLTCARRSLACLPRERRPERRTTAMGHKRT